MQNSTHGKVKETVRCTSKIHALLMSIKNWMGPYQRTPKEVAAAIRFSGLGVRSVGPVGDFLDNVIEHCSLLRGLMSCLFKCWLPVCVMDHPHWIHSIRIGWTAHSGFGSSGSCGASPAQKKKWLLAGNDVYIFYSGVYSNGGFLQQLLVFLLKNDHFVCFFGGYHHFRKPPCDFQAFSCIESRKIIATNPPRSPQMVV